VGHDTADRGSLVKVQSTHLLSGRRRRQYIVDRPADPAQNKPDLGPQFHDVGLSMRGTCEALA
jgi:hypothetical protein